MNSRTGASIILTTFNSSAYLPRMLDVLSNQTYSDYEIIIVDNGSDEENMRKTRSLLTGTNIRLVPLVKNFGPGLAWNHGAKGATGEYLCFLDPDTVIGKNFLSEMIDQYSKLGEDVGALMPLQLSLDGGRLNDFGLVTLELQMDLEARMRLGNIEVLFPYTCFVVRTKAFFDVGGFDEGMFWDFVDADFGWRLAIAGFRVISTNAAVAYHRDFTVYRSFRYFHYIKNFLVMQLKDWEFKTMAYAIPFFLARCVYSIIRGQFPHETFHAMTDVFCGLPSILRKRRQVQSRRRISDRELMRVLWFFMPVPWIRNSWREALRKSRSVLTIAKE